MGTCTYQISFFSIRKYFRSPPLTAFMKFSLFPPFLIAVSPSLLHIFCASHTVGLPRDLAVVQGVPAFLHKVLLMFAEAIGLNLCSAVYWLFIGLFSGLFLTLLSLLLFLWSLWSQRTQPETLLLGAESVSVNLQPSTSMCKGQYRKTSWNSCSGLNITWSRDPQDNVTT